MLRNAGYTATITDLDVSATGLNYWQLGEANYWGHNAIIRLAPFIRHCSLPELPGAGPFGGRIMSHDYVEAALMRRAGWEVWLATGLEGNYEECPGSIIEFAQPIPKGCLKILLTWLSPFTETTKG